MNNVNDAVEELKRRYLQIYSNEKNIPPNAWKYNGEYVVPAIPFVGKNYFSQPEDERIILYASAENLSNNESEMSMLCTEDGMYRSMRCFIESSDKYFPSVHIQPINDGGYLILAYQLLKRIIDKRKFIINYENDSPKQFLEKIACSNFGKYTILEGDGKTNFDYADNGSFLRYSHEYVKADIEILKPHYIIMPKTMYYKGNQQRDFFDLLYGGEAHAKVIPVYQINGTVVNCTINIKKNADRYRHYSIDELTSNEKNWLNNISRINKDNFLSVYGYADYEIEQLKRR